MRWALGACIKWELMLEPTAQLRAALVRLAGCVPGGGWYLRQDSSCSMPAAKLHALAGDKLWPDLVSLRRCTACAKLLSPGLPACAAQVAAEGPAGNRQEKGEGRTLQSMCFRPTQVR